MHNPLRASSRQRLLALVLVPAMAMAGCKSDKEELQEQAEAYGKDTFDKLDKLAEEGKAHGKDLQAQAEKLAEEGKAKGLDIASDTRDWAESSVDEVQDKTLGLVRDAKGDLDLASTAVNGILNKLARDPDSKVSTSDKIVRMMILMVPIVGPSKRYLDARRLFASGLENNKEEQKNEARRELLIAFVEAGLDIGTLGLVGSRIDLVATGADAVLASLKLTRSVGTLVGVNLGTFDTFVDSLLEDEKLRQSVDRALTIDPASIVP